MLEAEAGRGVARIRVRCAPYHLFCDLQGGRLHSKGITHCDGSLLAGIALIPFYWVGFNLDVGGVRVRGCALPGL